MKVLFLSATPSPYKTDFFNELGKYCELEVVYENFDSCIESEKRDETWRAIDAKNFKYCLLRKTGKYKSFFSNEIVKIIKRNSNSFIICGSYSYPYCLKAIIYMKLKRIDYSIHADGAIINAKENKVKFYLKKFIFRKSLSFFSSGKTVNDFFIYYGVPVNRIHNYPFTSVKQNQITNYENHRLIKENFGFSETLLIVSVGQIVYRKGFDVLIEAFGLLDFNANLIIIGGEASEDLKCLIKKNNIKNVEFKPFMPFEKVLDYIAAADVFVLTTREDIWGLVINEALAMGTPIISTDNCVAALELVENEKNGFVVPVNDPKETALRLKTLLENESLRNEIRKNNLMKAQKYTIENMALQYYKIISEVCKQN